MTSLNILRRVKRGFSLLEIMITLTIMSALLSLGAFMSMDSYRAYLSRSQRDTLVQALIQTRSRALANIFQTSWGLCYSSSRQSYVLFRGMSFQSSATNEFIPASGTITAVPSVLDCTAGGAGFAALSGTSTDMTITIVSSGRTELVTINHEGAIFW